VEPSATEPATPPEPPQPAPAPQNPGRGELYGPDPGVTPPGLISLPPVAYPDGFKAPKDEIFVMVEVLVGENGRVITARIAPRESAKKRFKDLALAEAKKASFRPATKNGVIGKMWATIRVPLPGE
jgi:TonB family protein